MFSLYKFYYKIKDSTTHITPFILQFVKDICLTTASVLVLYTNKLLLSTFIVMANQISVATIYITVNIIITIVIVITIVIIISTLIELNIYSCARVRNQLLYLQSSY